MLDIFFLHALYGASLPIGKTLLQFASPIFLAGIRMTIAGFLLLAFNFFKKQTLSLPKKHWWAITQIMFFGVYIKYVLRYWALNHMSVSKLSFLLNGSPFIAALFSYLFFKETMSRKQWIALIIGFCGIMPLFFVTTSAEQLAGQLFIFSWPELAVLIAMCGYCYGMIVTRQMVRDFGYSVTMTNGLRTFGGGMLALITSFFVEGFAPVTDPASCALWLTISLLLSNIICHNLHVALFKKYSVTFITFTDFLCSFFSAFYGFIFLHETITWHFFVSALIVVGALYLFYADELVVAKRPA